MGGSSDLVSVDVQVSPSAALRGVADQKVHVYFDVKTSHLPDQQARAPIDLCLVLDKSGSMGSQRKLETAKIAMQNVVRQLSSRDRLALVLYDTTVMVGFDFSKYNLGRDTEEICRYMKGIKTGSCTNLHGGLDKGFDLFRHVMVKQSAQPDAAARTSKIFLFSDGLANSGITSTEQIAELAGRIADHGTGITIDSFGVGKDFNEDLMRLIAECGAGRYLFIEGADAMDQFVQFALQGVVGLIARGAVLSVRGRGKGVVKAIHGFDVAKGATLHNLTSDNSRGILVQLDVTIEGDAMIGAERELLWYELNYTSATTGEKETITGTAVVCATDSAKEVENSRINAVEVVATIQGSAKEDTKVEKLVDEGKVKKAVKKKKKQIAKLEAAQKLEDNVKIRSQVTAQKRLLVELERPTICRKTVKKMHGTSKYHGMRQDANYCANQGMWDNMQLE